MTTLSTSLTVLSLGRLLGSDSVASPLNEGDVRLLDALEKVLDPATMVPAESTDRSPLPDRIDRCRKLISDDSMAKNRLAAATRFDPILTTSALYGIVRNPLEESPDTALTGVELLHQLKFPYQS